MKMIWEDEGVTLKYPTGESVHLVEEQGLAFLKWEDFVPLRRLLAESHIKGRQAREQPRGAVVQVATKDEEIQVNMIVEAEDKKNKHSEEWKAWAESTIHEDDAIFAGTVSEVQEVDDICEHMKEKCTIDTHLWTC